MSRERGLVQKSCGAATHETQVRAFLPSGCFPDCSCAPELGSAGAGGEWSVVDGLAHPPIVPVVATNVVVLLANIYEAGCGGKLGKYSYAIMQGGFGLLFLTEAHEIEP